MHQINSPNNIYIMLIQGHNHILSTEDTYYLLIFFIYLIKHKEIEQ